MLARRAITRPPTISTLTRQAAPNYSSILRPYSRHLHSERLWVKVRYRKDGQPRSRLAGAAFDYIDDSESALGLLASIIQVQHADKTFSQVDLQDPLSTLTYFKKLFRAFSTDSPEDVDELFDKLTRLMKSAVPDNAEGEAHDIMRTAAEQIHEALQKLNQESVSNTANYVLSVMREAFQNLIGLVEDVEDDSDTKYTFQLIRDRSKSDSGSEFESLG